MMCARMCNESFLVILRVVGREGRVEGGDGSKQEAGAS